MLADAALKTSLNDSAFDSHSDDDGACSLALGADSLVHRGPQTRSRSVSQVRGWFCTLIEAWIAVAKVPVVHLLKVPVITVDLLSVAVVVRVV